MSSRLSHRRDRGVDEESPVSQYEGALDVADQEAPDRIGNVDPKGGSAKAVRSKHHLESGNKERGRGFTEQDKERHDVVSMNEAPRRLDLTPSAEGDSTPADRRGASAAHQGTTTRKNGAAAAAGSVTGSILGASMGGSDRRKATSDATSSSDRVE